MRVRKCLNKKTPSYLPQYFDNKAEEAVMRQQAKLFSKALSEQVKLYYYMHFSTPKIFQTFAEIVYSTDY